MIENDICSIDDFFVSSESSEATLDLLDSYSRFEDKLKEIPNYKNMSDDSRLKFFREIHFKKNSDALFRRQDNTNEALVYYWLSKVKGVATLYSTINKIRKFNGITKEYLREIALMSSDVKELNNIEGLLSEKGIIFITEKSIPGLKIDGAVFCLESGQAVVALSLRYSRLDNFWFTLLHELSHLCLHFDQLESPIFEDLDGEAETLIEMEADQLALNSFVPRSVWRNCPPKYNLSEKTVKEFARDMSVHPAIIAGRLRKELNRYDVLSGLVNEINIQDVLNQ